MADTGDEALAIVHAFATPPPELIVPLPAGEWQIAGTFAPSAPVFDVSAGELRVEMEREFEGSVHAPKGLLEHRRGNWQRS